MPGKQKLPLVYAHRGARDVAPENTLAAFRAAIAAGADGVECDITRCATGEIVIIHDDTLDRTTNGNGKVQDTPFNDLRRLDAGAWFVKAFAGECIPTLVELLDLAQNMIKVNIEIKGMSAKDDGIEVKVAEMVRRRSMQDSVIISSFNHWALKRMHQADAELGCALLYTLSSPKTALERELHILNLVAVHPVHTIIDQDYVDWAHQQGYLVNVWTVNELADMEKMILLGVDGIITDHPALLHRLLADGLPTGRI